MSSKYRALVEAAERLCRTPIVDDDFPEMKHRFDGALREARAELDTAEQAGKVEGINVPAAQALIAAIGPGYRVIYRDAFRWKDEHGHVLPNHYECQNAPYMAEEHGHDLILDLGFAAILRDKRAKPTQLAATQMPVAVVPQTLTLEMYSAWCKANGEGMSFHLVQAQWAAMIAAAPVSPSREVEALLSWAVERWHAEVASRPMVNIHRRSLDDCWRQVIRRLGEDDVSLIGPRHDDLLAPVQEKAP